mgnify:CR=1 FL=1
MSYDEVINYLIERRVKDKKLAEELFGIAKGSDLYGELMKRHREDDLFVLRIINCDALTYLMEYDPYDMAFVGKVIKKEGENALVDFGGIRRHVSLSLVDAKEGDWVLVHAGYAIRVLREEEVEEDLKKKIKSILEK